MSCTGFARYHLGRRNLYDLDEAEKHGRLSSQVCVLLTAYVSLNLFRDRKHAA